MSDQRAILSFVHNFTKLLADHNNGCHCLRHHLKDVYLVSEGLCNSDQRLEEGYYKMHCFLFFSDIKRHNLIISST